MISDTNIYYLNDNKKTKKKIQGGRVSLVGLIDQLSNSKNVVTDWVIKECIKDRLNRKDFS